MQVPFSAAISDFNTHFCSNHDEVRPSFPCNSLDVDYNDRISCYRCTHCEDVYNKDHLIKRVCPEGTRSCFAVFDLQGRVRRGCFHHIDSSVNLCKALPSTCLLCNSNYCNSYRTKRIDAQCYKTRPNKSKRHMMTMRLEDCIGTSFADNGPACYMAESLDRPFIRAGCLNEVDVDLINYPTVVKGDLSVVRRDTLRCYKCTSKDPNYCYRIRFLEPEECKRSARYAIRGCYTIRERGRIERGCLTELDLYTQKMCTMRHFDEYCIMCRQTGCNIHR